MIAGAYWLYVPKARWNHMFFTDYGIQHSILLTDVKEMLLA